MILACFYTVYNVLGYGYLEAVYKAAMAHELRKLGLRVRVEAPLDVWYDGFVIASHRAGLIVEDRVVLELKAGSKLDPEVRHEILNNLRSSDIELGIILYFGSKPYTERIVFTRNIGRTKGDS